MSIDLIAGIGQDRQNQRLSTVCDLKAQESDAKAAIASSAMNPVDTMKLSDESFDVYLKANKKDTEQQFSLKKNFKDALQRFTNHALNINNYQFKASGKHAFIALNLLAEKSGVNLPGDFSTKVDETLSMLQEAWKLDDSASADHIYSQMVRIFGEDTSFQAPLPATLAQPESVQPAQLRSTENSPSVGLPPNNIEQASTLKSNLAAGDVRTEPVTTQENNIDKTIQDALFQFTEKLYVKNGYSHPIQDTDIKRVVNMLYEKLGQNFNTDQSKVGLQELLGIKSGSSIAEIMKTMERAYKL